MRGLRENSWCKLCNINISIKIDINIGGTATVLRALFWSTNVRTAAYTIRTLVWW